ncbi:MAG: hypothetical protein AB7U20_25115, partial [Planctomycetaceae bacterium]
FSQRAPCVLPPDAGKEQIVQHVNRNIQGAAPTSQGLASWDSSNVRLSLASNGPSMAVPAFIAVEAPRNFRLRVSMPLHGELADMGSNAQEFWFWAKYSPHPNVITASHDDLLLAQQRLSLPFHPDWLMEVLGVIPIDPESVTLRRPDQQAQIIELVSEHIAPNGAPLQKVIRIDSCHGIIREHALYDSRGVLIASARLGDHKIDEATGLVMPRVIRLDWPQMQQQITMRFNDMRVNPPSIPPAVWQVPEVPGCPRMELTQLLNSPQAGGLDPFGTLSMPQSDEMQPSRPTTNEASRDPFNDRSAGGAPPSAYSAGASQSSSGRRPRGRGLWRWPWR